MQYENYEKKVAKVERVLKFVFRHALIFILSFSLIMAAVIALLATKGIITGTESCPETITYGEGLGYSADAFISDVQYEYRAKGKGEWTTEPPKDPGKYEVRAAAKALFGYRYSDAETFTINPKKVNISITSESVVYGDDPTVSAELAFDDRIGTAQFIYNEKRDSVELDLETLVILDAKGRNVTSRYEFTTEGKNITTLLRPITITTADKETVYDANTLTGEEYTLSDGSIAGSDTLGVVFTGAITDVGSTKNSFEYSIVNGDGEDVSRFYNVTKREGTLSVLHRNITVSTQSDTVTYDGAVHTKEEYKISEGSLAAAHTESVFGWASIKTVGSLENTVTVRIMDGTRDVSGNYSITYVPGTLEVTARPITVSTGSMEWVYDAKEHTHEVYTVGGMELAAGDRIGKESFASVKYASDNATVNNFTFEIFDADGNLVTSNYDIRREYGALKITKRPLNVTTPTEAWTYDGTEHSATELISEALADGDEFSITSFVTVKEHGEKENSVQFTVIDENRNDVLSNYDLQSVVYGKLTVKKRAITVTSNGNSWEYDANEHREERVTIGGEGIVDAQRYEIVSATPLVNVAPETDNIVEIFIYDGDTDVTDNYEISYVWGKVSVYQRPVTVITADGEMMYDGTALSSVGYEAPALVDGHYISVTKSTELVNAETVPNEFIEYDILDQSGNSVLANYNVSFVCGNLTVTRRPITVTTESASKIYDAKPLTAQGWKMHESTPNPLVGDHRIDSALATVTGTITNVGYIYNSFAGEVRIFGTDGDVTRNYEITYLEGTLTVDPRPLTVYTADVKFVYDGLLHYDNTLTPGAVGDYEGLCAGHSLMATLWDSFATVSDTGRDNAVSFIISDGTVDEFGELVDLIGNYTVTPIYGKVEVTPRRITVATPDINKMYDGYEVTAPEVYVHLSSENGLCFDESFGVNHYFIVTAVPSFKTVSDTGRDNAVEFIITDGSFDEFGSYTDIGVNYAIDYEYGEVNIDPRPITVGTQSIDSIYNGFVQANNAPYDASAEYGLCTDEYGNPIHTVITERFEEYKNYILDKENTADVVICDEFGEPVTDNYVLSYAWGTVNIQKRPITLYTDSHEGVYDGLVHATNLIYIRPGGENYGLPQNEYGDEIHTLLQTDDYLEFKNAIDLFTNRAGYDILDENGDSVIDNYEVTEEFGTVSISKRPVSIYTLGCDTVYDSYVQADNSIYFNTGAGLYGLPTDAFGYAIHRAEPKVYIEYRNATLTQITNSAELVIYDESGIDVTANYTVVDQTFGTVMIAKRPVAIKTDSYSGIYDGYTHADNQAVYDGENSMYPLCDQHTVVTYDEYYIYGDAFTGENKVGYDIVDENGDSVRDNYEVTELFGYIDIAKRPIGVYTDSCEAIYDGAVKGTNKIYVSKDPAFYDLCTDKEGGYIHELSVTGGFSVYSNACENVENRVAYDIIDQNGNSVKDNYDISESFGLINIKKRPISVYTESYEGVYTGLTAADNSIYFEVVEGEFYDICRDDDGNPIHFARPNVYTYFTNFTGGPVENSVEFEIYDNSNTPVTQNYEIVKMEFGTVNITKRTVSPYTESYSGIYSGEIVATNDVKFNTGAGLYDLPTDESGNYIHYAVASKPVVFKNVTNGVIENTVDFVILDSNYINVTDNYEILPTSFGSVEITHRPITVTVSDYYGVYDGQEHGGIELIEAHDLCNGHSILVTDAAYIKNVGIMSGIMGFYITDGTYTDGVPTDVTGNYVFDCSYEYTITIVPREVTVMTGSGEWEYDGFEKSCELYSIESATEFISSHERIPTNLTYITEIGSTENVFELIVLDDDGIDVSKTNYKITYVYGTLVVNPRMMYLETASDEKAFDGMPLTAPRFDFVDGLLEWHYIDYAELVFTGTITEPGEAENTFDISTLRIIDEYGNDVTPYYDLENSSFYFGTLTVTDIPPIDLIIDLVDQPSKVYDGKPLYGDNRFVSITDSETGETITEQELLALGYTYSLVLDIDGLTYAVNAGNYAVNIFEFRLYDPDGNEVYEGVLRPRCENVKFLNITPEVLQIYLFEKRPEYDAGSHGYASDEYGDYLIPDGFKLEITDILLSATDVRKCLTVSQINSSIESYFMYNVWVDGVDYPVEHFNVKLEVVTMDGDNNSSYKPLEIRRRSLEIVTSTAAWTYDGKEHHAHSYDIKLGSLAKDQWIEMTYNASIIGKGTKKNTVMLDTFRVYAVIDGETVNVTDNYINYDDTKDDFDKYIDEVKKVVVGVGDLTVT